MTNPNQEQQPEKLTLGEAIRAIAERTAFRTEDERNSVMATLDEHIDADKAQREQAEREQAERDEQADETPADETPAQPVKATPATATRRGK